ncbi:MAG TPA: alpha/beta fold hydrolase [Gammaproteobacteria bacterium]|nr:alpha/beta fold hydrolase [Gammaproteobacteria bacterium]
MPVELQHIYHGDGKPAVLLHGLFGSGKNMSGMARNLADQGYRVYLPDLRNHGQSPHTAEMSYPLMAEDLYHYLQQHDIREPLLVGHSMGGKVAMTAALQDESCCERLIIMDIAPVDYGHSFNTIIRSLKALNPAAIKNRRDADEKLAETLQPAALRQFLLQNLVRVNSSFKWRMNLDDIQQHIAHISDFPDLHGRRFPKPVLFLGGALSGYLAAEHEPVIRKYFPAASIEHIDGAGHWLHAEAPRATLAAINAFLE